jgi:integrase
MKLSDIAPGCLCSYAAERSKEVSSKTLLNEVTLMKQLFRHAYHWGYTRTNLAEFVKRPKQEKSEIEILEPDEVQLFLSHSDSHYRVAFLAGFLTGMRAGEIWGLQWGDIDWNSNQIFVKRSLWKGRLQTPKTSYSIRRIDIPESLVHELKKWRLACPSILMVTCSMTPSSRGKHKDSLMLSEASLL